MGNEQNTLGGGGGNTLTPNLSNALKPVRVIDIILDSSHPSFEQYGGYDSIGMIFWSNVLENKDSTKPTTENRARPFFQSIKQYPLKNEVVLIIDAPSKTMIGNSGRTALGETSYYIPNVNIWNHPHNNALPDMRYYNTENDANNYGTVEGVMIRNPDDDSVEIDLGNYFKEQLQIQPLLPFEGDTIIEGRFGNSIRFGATAINIGKGPKEESAYSTKGNTGDPITIIRNGALVEEEDNGWEHTLENINTDHSAIYLTSNQILPNFKIVTPNWDSWLAKHDVLDVGEGEDDFDNILKGPIPDVLEVDEEPIDKDTSETEETFREEEITEDTAEEFPKEPPTIPFKYGWDEEDRTDIDIESSN